MILQVLPEISRKYELVHEVQYEALLQLKRIEFDIENFAPVNLYVCSAFNSPTRFVYINNFVESIMVKK